jgi:4-hydroxy-4-methyl-2-oxoglutarate aldolase
VVARLVPLLRELGVATLHEAAGRTGQADPHLRPVLPEVTIAGRALTARCQAGDNLAIHRALAVARAGDILVVDAGGHLAGYWGELMAVAAQARGVVGLVIDGGVRDVAALRRLGFPTWSTGVSVLGCLKVSPGEVGGPIVCGGVSVATGDLVVADDDGVVFLPRKRASAIADAGRQRVRHEQQVIERLRAGETTLEVLGLEGA